jgi:hypothetical protein
MNFKDLYVKGMLKLLKEKEASDAQREKSYRGGNVGILHSGIPANSCARKMIARSEGRFEETSWNTQLMFDMGELNEVRWHDKLTAAGIDVKSADDLVRAETTKGMPITGSPDSIVANGFLIEHKHLSSFWTFRDKVIEGNPSLEHLAQAGFYSMHLNDMPFCLLYSSSVKFSGPSFLTNLVPKPTEAGSENFEYTYYYYTGKMKTWKGKSSKEKKKLIVPGHLVGELPHTLFNSLGADFAEFKNTIPTIVQFDLRWDNDGYISYKDTNKTQWTKSVVSKDNIMAYYNYAEECEETKTLPKRPLTLDSKGGAKGFDSCNYCSLADVCDKYEAGSYDQWLKMAKDVRW